MSIIVTGGTGLVGKYLQQHLDATYLSSKEYDLTKEQDVERMYQTYSPKTVIHLAAKVGGIIDNINNPFDYFEDNVLMNTFMLKYARKYNVTKFLGVLSSCIYPDVSNHYPLLEEDLHLNLPNENNFGYGYAKRLMGVHIDLFKKEGYDYSYIIPNNLYGEFEVGDLSKKHFIGALLEKIKLANQNNSDNITLFGDGTPLRQFTYADDIARIIQLMIEYNITENLNVGIEENYTIDKIAKIALQATNSNHLKIEYDITKPNGQYRKDISTSKFQSLFSTFEFTSYIEGIKKTYSKINESN
jgi:GDP-L-fucose synthase